MQADGTQIVQAAKAVYVGLSLELVFYPRPDGGWSVHKIHWLAESPPYLATMRLHHMGKIRENQHPTFLHFGVSGTRWGTESPQTHMASTRTVKAVWGRASTPGHMQLPTCVGGAVWSGASTPVCPQWNKMKWYPTIQTLDITSFITCLSFLFQFLTPLQMFPSTPK